MNACHWLTLCALSTALIACTTDSNELQNSHLKARADLAAALSGNLPIGTRMHITHYGRSVENLPQTCAKPQLLPLDIHPEKGRFTYLIWCEKRLVSVARIERADNVKDISLIFMDVKSHCDQRPKKCEVTALDSIDLPVKNLDGVTQ
jgi:hypothetical protein